MFPHVSANCHCAAAIDRIEESADASFPLACMPRYSVNATPIRMPIIAITTISSSSVNPRSGFARLNGPEGLDGLRVNRFNP